MMVLITYDVNTENAAGRKRLRQIAKACQDYGQRVQNSVFECLLDAAQCAQLQHNLRGLMDEADRLTAGDPEDNARVGFLRKGLDVADEQLKMYEAWNTGRWKPMEAAREKYMAFLREFIPANPVALCPHHLGYAGAYLRGAPRRIAPTPPPKKDMSKAKTFVDGSGNLVEIEDGNKKGKKK